MGCVRWKPGARLDKLTIGGACLLAALARTASYLPFDLMVTSGTDGVHPAPDNPHAAGNALDVRSQDLPTDQVDRVLRLVMGDLAMLTMQLQASPTLESSSGGIVTGLFFGWLEDAGTDNEHYHFQVRNGREPVPQAWRRV